MSDFIGKGYIDLVSIEPGKEGESAKYVILNGEQIFKFNDSNYLSTPQPELITIEAQTFNINVQIAEWQYYKSLREGWATIESDSKISPFVVDPFSDIWQDKPTLRLRLLVNEIYFDEMSIVKLADGSDNYVAILSNESQLIPVNEFGEYKSEDLALIQSTVQVFKGAEEIDQSLYTLSVKNQSGIVSQVIGNIILIESLDSDIGVVELNIRILNTNTIIGKTFTLAKAFQGASGSDGITPPSIDIIGEQVFSNSSNGYLPTMITLTAYKKNFSSNRISNTAGNWYYEENGAWWSVATDVSEADGYSMLRIYPNSLAFENPEIRLMKLVYKANINEMIYDETSIVKVDSGIGYTVILSNESSTVKAKYDGTEVDLSPASTFIYAYHNTNMLLFTKNEPQKGQYTAKVLYFEEGGATIDDTGLVQLVSFKSEYNSLQIPIEITLEGDVKLIKYMIVTKSFSGEPGEDGAPGPEGPQGPPGNDDLKTQEEVFDRLTNGGQNQGIYLEDKKIYLNATYIKTGTIDASLITVKAEGPNLFSTGLATMDYGIDENNKYSLDGGFVYLLRAAGNPGFYANGRISLDEINLKAGTTYIFSAFLKKGFQYLSERSGNEPTLSSSNVYGGPGSGIGLALSIGDGAWMGSEPNNGVQVLYFDDPAGQIPNEFTRFYSVFTPTEDVRKNLIYELEGPFWPSDHFYLDNIMLEVAKEGQTEPSDFYSGEASKLSISDIDGNGVVISPKEFITQGVSLEMMDFKKQKIFGLDSGTFYGKNNVGIYNLGVTSYDQTEYDGYGYPRWTERYYENGLRIGNMLFNKNGVSEVRYFDDRPTTPVDDPIGEWYLEGYRLEEMYAKVSLGGGVIANRTSYTGGTSYNNIPLGLSVADNSEAVNGFASTYSTTLTVNSSENRQWQLCGNNGGSSLAFRSGHVNNTNGTGVGWSAWKRVILDYESFGRLYVGNSNTHLTQGSDNTLRLTNNYGYLNIGPQNTSHCHFRTDRPNFWFEKDVRIQGEIYAGSSYSNRVYHTGYKPTASDVGARSNTAPASGGWFKGTPLISSDGVMEVGKYIDFHQSNTTTVDYDARLASEGGYLYTDTGYISRRNGYNFIARQLSTANAMGVYLQSPDASSKVQFYTPNANYNAHIYSSGGAVILRGSYIGCRNSGDSGYVEARASKFTVNSEEKWKTNVEKYKDSALDKINNTNIYTYNRIEEEQSEVGLVIDRGVPTEILSYSDYRDDRESDLGIVSQSVQDRDISINLYSMTAMAWKAVQELFEDNKKLKEELEEIKSFLLNK